jgi:hypothetical protein
MASIQKAFVQYKALQPKPEATAAPAAAPAPAPVTAPAIIPANAPPEPNYSPAEPVPVLDVYSTPKGKGAAAPGSAATSRHTIGHS